MDDNSDLSTPAAKPSFSDSDSAAVTAIANPNPIAPAAAAAASEGGGSGDDDDDDDESAEVEEGVGRRRTPFSSLSQVDADLALARTLQEQERAFMMLRMNGDGSDYGSWEGGSYYHDDELDDGDLNDDEYDEFEEDDDIEDLGSDHSAEPAKDDNEELIDHDHHGDDDYEDDKDDDDDDDDEDAFDVHAHADSMEGDVEAAVIDPGDFPDDEAYARALQDAEERELAARLWAMAGIAEREVLDVDDHGGDSQDAWEEVDPDELSYEELVALGEVVGTESRGLSADTIASLPSINFKSEQTTDGQTDSCVICRLDYEDGETLTVLSCKHSYHSECIINWLKINKVCPICSAEVSSSVTSS